MEDGQNELRELHDTPGLEDWYLVCKDCGLSFVFTKSEQIFYSIRT